MANKAEKANPALGALSALVGEWRTTATHPYLAGRTLHGRTVFDWIEGGAFLRMRSQLDAREVPDGIAIFGSDDALGTHHMLYFDERGVSRRHDVELRADGLTWRRDDPAFRQRFVVTIAPDGRTMRGRGEMSRDGGAWEGDLQVDYERA